MGYSKRASQQSTEEGKIADLASLSININAGPAKQAAAEVKAAVTDLGAAGAKVGEAYQNLFQRINAAGSGSGAGGLAALTAEASRARDVFALLEERTTELSLSGDKNAASFAQMAQKAATASAAITEITGKILAMVANGANATDVVDQMSTALLEVGRNANFSGAEMQKTFQGALAGLTPLIDAEMSLADRTQVAATAINQMQAAAQAAAAAEEKLAVAAKSTGDSLGVQATNEAKVVDSSRAAAVALNEVAAAEEKVGMAAGSHLATAGNFVTNLTMGAQMLSSGTFTGAAFGIQQVGAALSEGAVAAGSMNAALGFMLPALAVVAAAFMAAHEAVKLLGEGMKGAAEDETAFIGMKTVMGSVKAAAEETQKAVDFATTGKGTFLNADDVKQGVLVLNQLTSGALATADGMQIVAGAAATAKKSFTDEAGEIGKLYSQISTGQPLRAMLLQQLVSEGVLNENVAIRVRNMAKEHASAADTLKVLTDGLRSNSVAAEMAANSWTGVKTELSNIVNEDFLQPIGAAINGALKPVAAELSGLLLSHKGEIQSFADDLELSLLTAFHLIKNEGLGGAMHEGIDALGTYMQEHLSGALIAAGNTAWENYKTGFWGALKYGIDQLAEALAKIGKTIQGWASGVTPSTVAGALAPAVTASDMQGYSATGLNQREIGSGPLRAMSYGPIDGEHTRATTEGPLGNLQMNDIAVSQAVMNQMGLKMGDFVDIVDKFGNTLLEHQRVADTSWIKPGVDTGGFETWNRHLGTDFASIRPEGMNAMQAGYGSRPAPGETPIERARREAQADIAKSQQYKDTPPNKGTGDSLMLDGKAPKADNSALKEADALIKQISADEQIYGTNVQTVNEKIKAGMISSAEGHKQELALVTQEIANLRSQTTTLERYQSLQKQGSPQWQKEEDAIRKARAELEKLLVVQQQLSNVDPWKNFLAGANRVSVGWDDLTQQANKAGGDITQALSNDVASGLTALIDGSKSAGEAFSDMAKSIISDIEGIIIKMLVELAIKTALNAVGGMAGGGSVDPDPDPVGYARGGPVRGFAPGGFVGPDYGGTPGSDSVHAMLMPGEFVMDVATVNKFGLGTLTAMQKQAKGFATGGPVSGGAAGPTAQSMAGGGLTINVPVSVSGDSGGGRGKMSDADSMSPQDKRQLSEAIKMAVQQEMTKQKRPGGILARTTGGG